MIYEVLSEGAGNAQTARFLCDMLNIKKRDLTRAIEKERREGHPICAATGAHPGYFLAATQEEMLEYCGRLFHRAGEIFKTRRACLATLRTLPEVYGGMAPTADKKESAAVRERAAQ